MDRASSYNLVSVLAVQRGRIPTQPLLPGQFPFGNGDFMNGHSFLGSYITALMRAEPYAPPRYACLPTNNYIGGMESILEMASKLLFSTVEWCRGIPFFHDLTLNDQICLLRNCWSELFILNAAQFALPLSPHILASNLHSHPAAHIAVSHFGSTGRNDLQLTLDYYRIFQDRVEKLKALHVDGPEYSCLKAIVLYSAGKQELQVPRFLVHRARVEIQLWPGAVTEKNKSL